MSRERTFSMRIPAILLIFLCLSQFTPTAQALEGFKFVVRQAIPTEKPLNISSLGKQPGFVVYDGKDQKLVFLDEDFNETNRIGLARGDYTPKEIISLAFDRSRERLFVFDAGNRDILVFDVNGRFDRMFNLTIKTPDYFGFFSKPTGMAIDTQGTVYVADCKQNDIKAFTLDGTYLFSMHLPLNVMGEKPEFCVSALTVLADGTVAAIDSEADNLVLFSREGRFISERTLEGDYETVKKLITLDSGELMGIDTSQKIFRWTVRGKQTAGLGSKGTSRGQFSELADITCDREGNIVAMDSDDGDVQIFAFDSPVHPLPAQTEAAKYRIEHLSTDTITGEVVGLLPDGVILFDPQSRIITMEKPGRRQEFKHPDIKKITCAYANDEMLYAFDRSRSKVFAFKLPNGYFAFDCGQDKLDDVTRILPAPGNSLVFSDEDDTKIKIFSQDGIMSAKFGDKGDVLPQEIERLRDITWHRDQLAVLDSDRGMLHLFSPNGSFIRNIEIKTAMEDTDFSAVESDPNGFLLVLDSHNGRILLLDDDGKVTFRFGSRGDREQDWQNPSDFLFSADGTLRVLDNISPPKVLTYKLCTPGILCQAELAIDSSDWEKAVRLLQPYLSRDFNGSPEDIRAMSLTLTAYARSAGQVPSKMMADKAKTAIRSVIQNQKEAVDKRLVLAACYRQDNQIEDAIAVLKAGQRENPDEPRYGKVIEEYAKLLQTVGELKYALSIKSCQAPPIMGAIYQTYMDNPEIQLSLTNDGGKSSPPCKALFFAKAIMDNPTETDIPSLNPFSEETFNIRATLNRNVLTYVENTRLGAQVQVVVDGQPPVEKNLNIELFGRNSMNWGREKMIACFVTPKDPDIQMFARQAVKTAGEQTIQSDLDPNLFKALTLFDAMQGLGMYYMPDPIQPFNFSRMSEGTVIDYVQFPRETLLRLSGDCDDLSILYASLLEGTGIETVMVTSPGHIFTAFKLATGKQAVDSLGLSEDLLLQHKGDYYIPVETTLMGSPFISAWRVAANTVATYSQTQEIGIIDIAEAWETYQTVSLPPVEREIPLPGTEELKILLKRELDALNLRQVEKRLALFKRWLEREPENVTLLILLARRYSEVGVFDQAEEYALRAQQKKPGSPEVNQAFGNIAYMQNEYEKALELYRKADAVSHTAAIQINIALAHLKAGQLVPARKAFQEARTLDDELVNGYPELAQLLE
jgi:tetratricopeptide (TPR) repeat protein